MLKRISALTLCWLFTTPAIAQWDSKQIFNITNSHDWRALLHFNNDSSMVDDTDFFFSANGHRAPDEELSATLEAFYQPVSDANQHPVCRFPARWNFLSSELHLPAAPIALADCPEYQSWLSSLKAHSVSLIFASSYLNSPSSMFGHTFLRIDQKNVEEVGSTWLSFAVNFGATINNDDNSIMYAYRGLLGGYPGFFSVIPYYDKIKEYSRIENRDLWEYNLNLTKEETARLTNHLWELREIDFDYYFFDENCSYRLLELLEYARPSVSLREDFSLRAIPIDTIRAVLDANLVTDVTWRPSVTSKNQYEIDDLKPELQPLALQLSLQEITLDDDRITTLDEASKGQIIIIAYEHLRYLQLNKPRDPVSARYSLTLLRELNKTSRIRHTPPTPTERPDEGHKTQLAGLTTGVQDSTGFADVRFRMSYHDLADNPAGYLNGAAINLGELHLRKRESDSIQIENMNVIDIASHSPRSLFFDPITWRAKVGFERIYSDSDDDLVAQANGGAGLTYAFGDHSLVYGMAIARLEYNELLNHNWAVGAGALAGGLLYLPFGTLQLESNYYQFSDGLERYQHQLIQNINIGRNNAVRLKATHQKQVETNIDEFSLEFRHYF